MMRRNSPQLLSVRSQMLVEKMNAFYLRNWDKEVLFDLSQRVVPRRERHWWQKSAPRNFGMLRTFKHVYTEIPYHKSDDGQSPGDIMNKDVKPKYFWCEPSADFYLHKDLPGGHRDYHLAWESFYEELQKAAFLEPEQVFTLLNDILVEGYEVPPTAYEKAEQFLEESRERRVSGIKPPVTFQTLQRKDRWQGANPVFEEEWDPVLPFTHYSQANPAWSYKPLMENNWVHDPAPWKDGELPPPTLTRHEHLMQVSSQRKNIMLQEMADDRFRSLLDGQNKDLFERWSRMPESFAGDPQRVRWLEDSNGDTVRDARGTPLMLNTDIDHFIDIFYDPDLAAIIFFWKYTSDHIMLRHLVFEKTGKTLLEYSEPERFAMLYAILAVKKQFLFESPVGKLLSECYTDSDYIDAFGEEPYRQFLRMEQRIVDEERRKQLRLWSTEVAKEERLDQVVEVTRMKLEEADRDGVYGHVSRVKDRLDRRKWTIKEPSRHVQEHEKMLAASSEERRQMFDDEMADLTEEARLAYGDQVYGRQTVMPRVKNLPSGRTMADIPDDNVDYSNPTGEGMMEEGDDIVSTDPPKRD
eukprot:TRINITY_DN9341_c0_g2_i1.p1 TRINITY_DN9341_c0_g2~~TRINITY_DN9341_c0_g2_i1.p1  ORF type:complete len:581 (+),score=216.14 TRINITY_DN9341_c0_g2_i1:140-1882(+)